MAHLAIFNQSRNIKWLEKHLTKILLLQMSHNTLMMRDLQEPKNLYGQQIKGDYFQKHDKCLY